MSKDVTRALRMVLVFAGFVMLFWGAGGLLDVASRSLDFPQLVSEATAGIHVWSIPGVASKYISNIWDLLIALVEISLAVGLFKLRGAVVNRDTFEVRDAPDQPETAAGYAIGAQVALWAGVLFLLLAIETLPFRDILDLMSGGRHQYSFLQYGLQPAWLEPLNLVVFQIPTAVLGLCTAIAAFHLRRKLRLDLNPGLPGRPLEGSV